MGFYELLLFAHILAVTLWIGSELYIETLVAKAERRGDFGAVRRLFDDANSIDAIFVPATLLVLVTGILMVIDGPWSFGTTWVLIGLVGYGVTFAYAMGVLQPQVNRIQATLEPEGGVGSVSEPLLRRFFVLWRIETVGIILIAFAMVTKPAGGDTGVLLAIAAVALATIAWVTVRVRAIPVPDTPAVEPGGARAA